MPTIFGDSLRVSELVYTIDTSPLEPLLHSLPERPAYQKSPFTLHGYRARWSIRDGFLQIEGISAEPLMSLFGSVPFPVCASWFSGVLHGVRGDSRYTGWPPYKFCNDEIVVEIADGRVTREWLLDLSGVRDQTDEELRLSLPSFMWPAHLRDGTSE